MRSKSSIRAFFKAKRGVNLMYDVNIDIGDMLHFQGGKVWYNIDHASGVN